MTINYQFPFYPYNNYQQPTCGGYGFQPTTMYNQQNPYRGFENSYIENILRMNLGKNATIYMNFENSQWGSKVFKGELVGAGRDHILSYHYIIFFFCPLFAQRSAQIQYERREG